MREPEYLDEAAPGGQPPGVAEPESEAVFRPFPKIARLNRNMVVTEKIDGTNGVLYVSEDGRVRAGSKSRWLSVGKQTDNFGFAAWAREFEAEIAVMLGPGYHYGEWWGRGIQRGYGLPDRRFSLFNTRRWPAELFDHKPCNGALGVVPTLAVEPFSQKTVDLILTDMRYHGSYAAPFMNAEGVVVYHEAARTLFKVTLEGDSAGKGEPE